MRFLLFLLFLLCASNCIAADAQTFPSPLRTGLELLNNGNILEAIDVFQKYETANPFEQGVDFLLAHAVWRKMWLGGYTPAERQHLVDLLNRVDKEGAPYVKTDDHALFYSAATAGLRAQLMATENEWWETAQIGKKMKNQASALIERNPEYYPAFYLLGSYNYFADALPGYIKFLRTLVFLPSGDRKEGQEQLVLAYVKGGNVSVESGRTLAIIYTYFEKRFDYGLQMCDNILSLYPHNYEIGLYKGINLYYEKQWRESAEWLIQLRQDLRRYSALHGEKKGVVPLYLRVDREAQYWIARSLIQQKHYKEARMLLADLADPELHEPFWLMRGVFLSRAFIEYVEGQPETADMLINKVLLWKDAKDSHDKADTLREKRTEIDTFDIDFL